MNLEEYQPLALRSAKDLGSLYMNLWHGACGMQTEFGEVLDAYKKHYVYGRAVDRTNVLEELGDIMWYLALFCKYGEYSFDIAECFGEPRVIPEIPVEHALLLGLAPCLGVFYLLAWEQGVKGEEDRESNQATVGSAIRQIESLAMHLGSTLSEVLTMNIAKLEKRYKNSVFTAEAALNRDTEAERAVLDVTARS